MGRFWTRRLLAIAAIWYVLGVGRALTQGSIDNVFALVGALGGGLVAILLVVGALKLVYLGIKRAFAQLRAVAQ